MWLGGGEHRDKAANFIIRSVLGAYFLNERLGILGKIGCSTCLIGSVIIVLHAPPDKEIETIDEILHFAIQPGETWPVVRRQCLLLIQIANSVLDILLYRRRLRGSHDLPRRSQARPQKSSHLHLHLLDRRLRLDHGCQGVRHCFEADYWRQQPIYSSLNICVRHHSHRLHSYTNELFQQGAQPVFHQLVSNLLIKKGAKVM